MKLAAKRHKRHKQIQKKSGLTTKLYLLRLLCLFAANLTTQQKSSAPAVIAVQPVRGLAQFFRIAIGQINPIDDADDRGFD
jgi:hypothetical protein